MQKIEHNIDLSAPTIKYRVTFFTLNGKKILDALTTDKDAAIQACDWINHTPGSKMRASIAVEAGSVNTLVNPLPL